MNEPNENPSRFWDWFITAGVLLALFFVLASLFPPVGSHRASLHMQSLNNVFQISMAITNYATENGGLLPAGQSGTVKQSWRLALCPMLDRSDIARAYHADAAWDAPENQQFTGMWVPVMTSPLRPKPRLDAQGRAYTDYGLITGPGTANPPEGPVTLDFISEHDGLGQTMLVGECSGLQLIWTEPRDPDVFREKIGIAHVASSKGTADSLLSSFAQSHAVALFADGSGKTLSYNIDPKVLAALCTVNGREAIRYEDLRQ